MLVGHFSFRFGFRRWLGGRPHTGRAASGHPSRAQLVTLSELDLLSHSAEDATQANSGPFCQHSKDDCFDACDDKTATVLTSEVDTAEGTANNIIETAENHQSPVSTNRMSAVTKWQICGA